MDEEMRRAFEKLEGGIKEGQGKLEGRIDALANTFSNHSIESAVRWKEVDARARSAHHRLDEHLDQHQTNDERRFQSRLQGKGMLIATWTAILTTVAGLIVTIVLALSRKA